MIKSVMRLLLGVDILFLSYHKKEWGTGFLSVSYTHLKLYEKYKEKDFVVIGFPANNFMGQEPGSNEGRYKLI